MDDSSYDSNYERAMERLSLQAPWWTHKALSDPGITLLEMWALLVDMQSYYMDQVQESHYRKYLKLLGIREDMGECAAAWVSFGGVDESCIIPRGTKLLADRMVFETEEEEELTANALVGFYQRPGKNLVNIMNISRKNRFRLQEDKEGTLFSFVLQKPVEAGRQLRLYVLLDEKEKRNPAGRDFYMAQLAWEYRTEKGWQEARVLRDDTRGLLYSGMLCLLPEQGAGCNTDGGCQIRCRVKAGAYDVPPVLYKLCLNVVRVVQKNTLCSEETAEFSKDCSRVALRSYLAKTGSLRVFQRQKEDIWKDITADCRMDPPVTAEQRERALFFEGEGQVKVLCMAEELAAYPVTGVAAQQIPLPWENLMQNSVELMLGQDSGSGLYRMYRREEPEEERYDNAWHWQEGENVIVLGDGRHGDIPKPSGDGLRLTSLALWEGAKGNVAIGRISQWEKPELFPGISCSNLLEGRGGRERKKPSEQFAEISKVLMRENRMVTEEDIRALALETPGLLLQAAKAEWRDGAAVVTVFPAKPLKSAYCVERYRSQVAEYLESFRMAGSRMEVVVADTPETAAAE